MPNGSTNSASPPAVGSRLLRSRHWHWRLCRLVIILGTLVATVRLTGWMESVAFYFPSRATFTNPPGCEDVWITTPDGTRLHAWFMRATDAAPGEVRPAILHCHGNAGNVETHIAFSQFLTHAGFHVLIFDYRGYGRSDPAKGVTRDAIGMDALAAYDSLVARPDVDPKHVGVYGVSLGSVFSLHVAKQRPAVAAVCTVAAFSSWGGVASDHVPVLGALLIPGGLEPRELVQGLGTRPYLILHGESDEIVPIRHARILEGAAKAANVPVQVTRIADADHNGIMDRQASRDVVTRFFKASLASDAPAR